MCFFFYDGIGLHPGSKILFIVGFLFIFLCIYIYIISRSRIHFEGFHILVFIYFSFIFFSSIWALNTSLAIVEGGKNILYLFFILFTTHLLKSNETEMFNKLIKTSIVLFFISFVFLIHQYLQFEKYSIFDLYSLKGLSGHKNLFSIFVFLSLIFSALGFFEFKNAWKIIALIGLIFQISLLIFLQTRSVWIGLIVFIGTFLFTFISKKFIAKISIKKTILLSLTCMLLLNLFFITGLPRILSFYKMNLQTNVIIESVTDPSSMNERVLVWDKTYPFIQDHPLLGVGANNWQIFFPSTSLPESYVIRDLNVSFQRPHNDFLWILSEYGLIGFNLFLLLIVPVCFFLLREAINNFSYKPLLILSGITGFLCISFFDFPKERIELNLLFFLLLSFGVHFSHLPSIPNFKTERKPGFLLNAGIVTLLTYVILIALLNFRGEFYTKKMYEQQKLAQSNEIIRLSKKASSFCYKMDPITFPLKWYSGTAYAQKQDYKNAMIDFKQAFKQHPYNYNLLNDMGSVNYVNGEIDSAIFYYSRSIEINPRYDEPKLNLISIYINKKQYENAVKMDNTLFHNSERRDYYRTLIREGLEGK